MLRRKITETLVKWKQKENKNPLLIKGCRQCGKTYAVRSFAAENYENIIYLNFHEHPEYSGVFSGSLDVNAMIMGLSAVLGANAHFIPGKTVIILDEIQECPHARTSLKFWKLDGRYDVIATGSLLGVKGYGDSPASVPVGYEEIVQMFPMDLEEFLWANGINDTVIEMLRMHLKERTPVQEPFHSRLRQLLYQYTIVGGMPAVVQAFTERQDLSEVLRMQRTIVSEYREDMIKYANRSDKALITECFDSIPKQLAKENKKFQYSLIKKGSTASKYLGSIQWIEDAGIIARCYNLKITELPLDGNADQDIFKIYMVDTGLFVSMLEDGTQYDILQGNLYGYKGAIFENLVADIFSKMNRKLYYYHKDSGLEVDFVIRYNSESTLVEIKATTGNTKSSRTILNHPEKYHVTTCIKMGDYNISYSNGILTLPTYMCFLLDSY